MPGLRPGSVIYWRKSDNQLEKGQSVNPLDSRFDLMRTNKIRLRSARIRGSNQRGWLTPKLPRLGMGSNLDPVVFSKEMLQFEDWISMAGSFLSFLGWDASVTLGLGFAQAYLSKGDSLGRHIALGQLRGASCFCDTWAGLRPGRLFAQTYLQKDTP